MTVSPSKVEAFMAMAETFSRLSTCPRRSVGCILVNQNNHIIGTGYNGVPVGVEHCKTIACPGANGEHGSMCWATHAEANAIIQCMAPQDIHACFTTSFPCISCFKLLLNTGVKEIYFAKPYPASEGEVYDLNAHRYPAVKFYQV